MKNKDDSPFAGYPDGKMNDEAAMDASNPTDSADEKNVDASAAYVSQIITCIKDTYIDEATTFASDYERETPGSFSGYKKRTPRFQRHLAAACIALLVVIGFAVFAFAIEAQEYNTAVAFFEENGLSTEGLSRAEVKAVYRDISEKKFSYGKTAEVLRQAVPGWEISQVEPTPEEIASLWDGKEALELRQGISFSFHSEETYDEESDSIILDKSVLKCYRDKELLWTAEFRGFTIMGYQNAEAGVAVWGFSKRRFIGERTHAWIALVDNEGTIKWQRRLDHDFEFEFVESMLSSEDGTWAVFSKGAAKYLCFSRYDADGNELGVCKTEVGRLEIWKTAHLGNGYLVYLGDWSTHATPLLYKLDREGHVTDCFSYETEDCEYRITDMIEYGEGVYLSAYAFPKQGDEGGRHEIANILDYCHSRENLEIISSEELTPIVRDNYTAVLLVCSPEGVLSPKTFYSVKGSLGGELSVNALGRLVWSVESISSVGFSPYTNAYSLWGNSRLFRYTFDAGGTLLEQTDTGQYLPYER